MTFVALLRSVNVGQRKVPMDVLRAKLDELGYASVRTYVQSGNVVFDAKGAAAQLEKRIAAMLQATFGFEVPTLVRTAKEIEAIARAHPFAEASPDDPAKLHVTFLAEAPSKDALARLARLAAGADRIEVVGREAYLHVPGSYAETKLSNAALEKALGVVATTRNLRTVLKLAELAA